MSLISWSHVKIIISFLCGNQQPKERSIIVWASLIISGLSPKAMRPEEAWEMWVCISQLYDQSV